MADTSSEGFKWTKEATQHLISLIEIAKEMNRSHNTNLQYEQIDTKWKGLKRTYKKVRENNQSTGNARRNWEYFDKIHSILFQAPEINPPATMSTEDTFSYGVDENVDAPEDFCTNLSQSRKRRRNCVDAREAAMERRHSERMLQTDKFLSICQQLVDKM